MTSKFDQEPVEKPNWRQPAGTLFILLLILIWSIIVVSLIEYISMLNFWLQLPVYIFAGIIWIFPIKPILVWMNTGKFRNRENGASDGT